MHLYTHKNQIAPPSKVGKLSSEKKGSCYFYPSVLALFDLDKEPFVFLQNVFRIALDKCHVSYNLLNVPNAFVHALYI